MFLCSRHDKHPYQNNALNKTFHSSFSTILKNQSAPLSIAPSTTRNTIRQKASYRFFLHRFEVSFCNVILSHYYARRISLIQRTPARSTSGFFRERENFLGSIFCICESFNGASCGRYTFFSIVFVCFCSSLL